MPGMTAATVLNAAADQLTRVGWSARGASGGGLDVHTAIRDAAGVEWAVGEDALRAVYFYLRMHPKVANGESDDLYAWNRYRCPDQDTAVALLRGAAQIAAPR